MKINSKSFIAFYSLCTLVALTAASPASAQDADITISRAQRTLRQIERLIAGIQERNGGSSVVSKPGEPTAADWKPLFDGKSLAEWKRTDFAGGGEVTLDPNFRGGPGAIVVKFGSGLSGLNWTGDVPKTNYEIALETMKIDGFDFMCGLTFPVGDSYASLILGGWGGGVVGISSIDNMDASENETTKYVSFPKDRWFKVRLRVTPARLEAWLDDKQVVDVVIAGRKISLRPGEIIKSVPLGLATYQTTAAYRDIKLRLLAIK